MAPNPRSPGCGPLLPDELQDDPSLPRAHIEFDEQYLLPGSQRKPSVDEGNVQIWPHDGCPQMAVAVAIAPAQVVAVLLPELRRHLLEEAFQIGQRARFVLDGGEGAGAAGGEDGDRTVGYAGALQRLLHLMRQIDEIDIGLGGEVKFAGFDRHKPNLLMA